ncbi:MAG: Fe-S cluster assembly protein SufD [Bacillota bacterium]
MSALAPYLEGFRDLPAPAQPWLRALKEQALREAESRGFPTLRDEAWKYTSLAVLEKRGFKPAAGGTELGAAVLAKRLVRGLDVPRAVFVNGRFVAGHSHLPDGMRALPLSMAADSLKALPSIPSEWHADTLTNLNTALFQDGLLLELDASAKCEESLELLHVSVPGDTPASHHLRHVVHLGERARMVLVERYIGMDGAKHLTNSVIQIELGKLADLTHVRIQEESPQGFHVGRALVEQAEGSIYRSHNLQLGAAWSRLDIHTRLLAEAAHAELRGLYTVDGRQHLDNHTRIDHLAKGTVSREIYRGILDGQGRAVFNGKVLVAPHAVKTDASQANHNLILSRGAQIDTKPELEIYADDVKCSHGATIGRLDEDQLFYLRSRGLDAIAARNLLVSAFAETLLGELPHPALTEYVRQCLRARIPHPEAA